MSKTNPNKNEQPIRPKITNATWKNTVLNFRAHQKQSEKLSAKPNNNQHHTQANLTNIERKKKRKIKIGNILKKATPSHSSTNKAIQVTTHAVIMELGKLGHKHLVLTTSATRCSKTQNSSYATLLRIFST